MSIMAEAVEQIERMLPDAQAELSAIRSAEQLEQFRIKWLGSNGLVKASMKLLGQVPKGRKPAMGQRLNAIKAQISAGFEQKKHDLSADLSAARDYVDVTEPGRRPQLGNRHILMKVVDELTEL